MRFPLIDFGGTGSLVHLAPANGFPLTTYRPIIEALTADHRVVAIPPRALWDDIGAPPETPGSWEMLGADIVEGLVSRGLGDVVLMGHSFGGVASLVATARHRTLVRALCLLDPTILPPAIVARFTLGKKTGWTAADHPFATAARVRRDRFADPEEAFRFWRRKSLFADWSDDALHRYVEGQLRPEPGGGFALRWSPEWEAYYYESFYPGVWDDVAALDPTVPILAIAGERSNAFYPEERARFLEEVPWAELAVIPGHGHLFPQSAPSETSRLIHDWLRRIG